jgi:hypothetical protein
MVVSNCSVQIAHLLLGESSLKIGNGIFAYLLSSGTACCQSYLFSVSFHVIVLVIFILLVVVLRPWSAHFPVDGL